MNEKENQQDSRKSDILRFYHLGGMVLNWTENGSAEPDEDGHVYYGALRKEGEDWGFPQDVFVRIMPERISKTDAVTILRKMAKLIEKEWHETVIEKMGKDAMKGFDYGWQHAGFVKRKSDKTDLT